MTEKHRMEPLADVESLYALALVAETGSLNAAATRLGVTQQAVSLRIRTFEARVGVPLLVRSPRGSTLTSAGELVAGWAAPFLDAATDFTQSVESLQQGFGKILRVGASLTIAEHLLPQWLAHWRGFRDDEPRVQLVAANSAAVIESVRRGEVELGFIESPSVPTDLSTRFIGSDEVVVVVPVKHPWGSRRFVTAEELATTPVVLRESGSGTRAAFEDALVRAGHPLVAEPAAELSTTLGVRTTIAAGTAPGILSSLAVADDLRVGRLRLVQVRGVEMKRPLTALWRGSRLGSMARGLLESVSAQ